MSLYCFARVVCEPMLFRLDVFLTIIVPLGWFVSLYCSAMVVCEALLLR